MKRQADHRYALHNYLIRLRKRIFTGYYRFLLSGFGAGTQFLGAVVIYGPRHVRIGSHCTINKGVMLNGHGGIKIGDYVTLSPGVMIHTAALILKGGTPPYKHRYGAVEVKAGAWIAAGAQLMPGVTVGEGALVAAGSVVTHDIPPRVAVAGVPARQIGRLDEAEQTD